MNIQLSKIELTKVILDIDNPKIIKEIYDFIMSKNQLTNYQKEAIDQALHSLNNNESISHDLVMEETKNKYSKYFNNGN